MIIKTYKSIRIVKNWLIMANAKVRTLYARHTGKRVIFLLGVPVHNNIGDLAIARAETQFIQRYLKNVHLIAIPFTALQDYYHMLAAIIREGDIIAGHGGGNMGDTYMVEEEMRRKIIKSFPKNKIIIFPQTMYFSDTEGGRNELAKSKGIYSGHNNLTLVAREATSFTTMRSVFHTNTIILTPDIVLSMNQSSKSNRRFGAMTCIREDIESTLDVSQKIKIDKLLHDRYKFIRKTDTTEPLWLFRLETYSFVIWKKFYQFRKSEIVVTDRLHGMVFAAITGTPCIALTNFNYKVRGTYDWIKDLGYVRFVDSVDHLENALNSLNTKASHSYNPERFKNYWQEIINLLNK